jgi:hypothetical protein
MHVTSMSPSLQSLVTFSFNKQTKLCFHPNYPEGFSSLQDVYKGSLGLGSSCSTLYPPSILGGCWSGLQDHSFLMLMLTWGTFIPSQGFQIQASLHSTKGLASLMNSKQAMTFGMWTVTSLCWGAHSIHLPSCLNPPSVCLPPRFRWTRRPSISVPSLDFLSAF